MHAGVPAPSHPHDNRSVSRSAVEMMNGRGDEIKAPSPLGRCNHTVQGCSVVKIDYYLSADEHVFVSHLTRRSSIVNASAGFRVGLRW